jgi:hypothetical protein
MSLEREVKKYRSIFAPSTAQEREDNFEAYWSFTRTHDGEILEDQKDLTRKKTVLADFQLKNIRSERPLSDPALFYRNYVRLKDDPRTFDRKTLLLTCLYKFARHEWVGISAAWDAIPTIDRSKTLTDKISRYHLCEEFCHVRLFHEMFRTFHLDEVQWVPLGKTAQWIYKIFPYFPETLMSVPAFLTELMGITFYIQVDRLLDEIFPEEPHVREHLRSLLHEIMVDELAHIGQRRNYIGSFGIRLAPHMFGPLLKAFFRDIPEAKLLLNIDQMVSEGVTFDYNQIPSNLLERSWIPSYCRVSDAEKLIS